MQTWAAQRDEQRAQAFWCELMTFHSMEEILVLDEMARDRSAMRGSFGWGARGCPPVQGYLPHYRDQRVSALCAFSSNGFEDWRMLCGGNFTTQLFDAACDAMLLQPPPPPAAAGTPPLVARFKCILIDNASIHTQSFEDAVAAAGTGAKVWRIPPYCAPFLSPLDNGAFGLATRFMTVNAAWLMHHSMTDALDYTFRNCCSPAGARWCFYNCNYYSKQ